MPGGHVEFGEMPEDALKREFLEEFSLPIEVVKVIDIFSYQESDSHTVGISYQITADVPEKINFDKTDTEEITWIKSPLEINNYFLESDHNYKILQKYFSNIN